MLWNVNIYSPLHTNTVIWCFHFILHNRGRMRVPKPWGFVSVVSRGPLDLFNEGKPCISCIDGQTSRNSAKIFGHLLLLLSVTVFLRFRPHPKVSRTDGSPPTRAKRTCWRNVQDIKDVGWRRCDKDFVENVPTSKKKELRTVQGTSSRLSLHKLHVLWSQTPH